MSEQDDKNPASGEHPTDDEPKRDRNTGDIKPPTRTDPPSRQLNPGED